MSYTHTYAHMLHTCLMCMSMCVCMCMRVCLQDAIEAAVRDTLKKAGPKRHILNLGHGVLVGTPEENVAHMFQLSKDIKYADLLQTV